MEVVGAVAATAQLVGMVVTILESISQLHDLVKHIPERYSGWQDELTILRQTLDCIRHNSSLQTAYICRVIEQMNPKVNSLVILCRDYYPNPKSKHLKRVLSALSACKIEPRILQSFQSLEHDKATLILAINLHIASNSIEIVRIATTDMSKRRFDETNESSTQSIGDSNAADLGPPTKVLTLLPPKDGGNVSNQAPLTRSTTEPVKICVSSLREWTNHCDTPFVSSNHTEEPRRVGRRNNTYAKIKVTGNRSVVGTTTGDQGSDNTFKNIELNGDDHMVGDHEPKVVRDFHKNKAHDGSNRVQRPNFRRNTYPQASRRRKPLRKGVGSEEHEGHRQYFATQVEV
ncbi:hypothetical protein GGR58DRAFT_465591 [Xylaria digitata]|nr:hypothetical protein GGR58DRAFT_465591 [Xylaria digitata]